MSTLSIMDIAFFLTETEESPKHVGGLLIFKMPTDNPQNFIGNLYEECLQTNQAVAPFNQIINLSFPSIPRWQDTRNFSIHNHIIIHTKKEEMSLKQLNDLAAELHTPVLDRSQPLWEFHIIDNVEEDRFAIYFKIHHAYTDGMTMSRWLSNMMSEDSTNMDLNPLWNYQKPIKKSSPTDKKRRESTFFSLLKMITGQPVSYFQTARGLAKMATQIGLETVNLTNNAISVPFSTDCKTPLTGQVSAGRQVVTARVSLDRVRAIREKTHCSLNHVALTCVDTALHNYLDSCGIKFDNTINISMPVSLRAEGDTSSGNKIGIVLVDLAPKTDDIYTRLREIGYALRNVRYQINDIPPSSIIAYTMLLGLSGQIAEMLKLSNLVAPMGHTLVSNVPGPKKPLFLKGAELEQMYPISTLPPGNRLNITLYSYAGYLNFGLVATKHLRELDKLGLMIEQAFDELENSA